MAEISNNRQNSGFRPRALNSRISSSFLRSASFLPSSHMSKGMAFCADRGLLARRCRRVSAIGVGMRGVVWRATMLHTRHNIKSSATPHTEWHGPSHHMVIPQHWTTAHLARGLATAASSGCDARRPSKPRDSLRLRHASARVSRFSSFSTASAWSRSGPAPGLRQAPSPWPEALAGAAHIGQVSGDRGKDGGCAWLLMGGIFECGRAPSPSPQSPPSAPPGTASERLSACNAAPALPHAPSQCHPE